MKIIILIILLTLTLSDNTETKSIEIKQDSITIDKNFFKHELQNSILEFANDTGINPDSIYMPFKDELYVN